MRKLQDFFIRSAFSPNTSLQVGSNFGAGLFAGSRSALEQLRVTSSASSFDIPRQGAREQSGRQEVAGSKLPCYLMMPE